MSNEDQPRDEQGQWTSGGAAGSSAKKGNNVSERKQQAGREKFLQRIRFTMQKQNDAVAKHNKMNPRALVNSRTVKF